MRLVLKALSRPPPPPPPSSHHTLSASKGASLVAQIIKSLPAIRQTRVPSLGREDSPGEGNGNPLHYSGLENPMDGGAWQATVHGVTRNQTQLSSFHIHTH